jgi:hypothetical protein
MRRSRPLKAAAGTTANSKRVERRAIAGYTTATLQELEALAATRSIPDAEINAVLDLLASDDPAGMLENPSREEVLRVAVHMNPRVAGRTLHAPVWARMTEGHPATRAIFYHEQEEVAAFARLGVADPGLVLRTDPRYWSAHAMACWREAAYWQAWSGAEGASIPAPAFLMGHPLRDEVERLLVRSLLLQDWGVDVPLPDPVELASATRFYDAKRVDRHSLR